MLRERDEFLGLLGFIHRWKIGALHLLATSGEERDIEDRLHRLTSHRVSMDQGLFKDDIRTHVVRTLDDTEAFGGGEEINPRLR